MILLAKQLKITTLHVSSPLHKIGWEPSQVVLLHDVGGHLFPLDEQDVAKCDQIFLGGRRHVLPIGPRALHGSLVESTTKATITVTFAVLTVTLKAWRRKNHFHFLILPFPYTVCHHFLDHHSSPADLLFLAHHEYPK